MFLNFLFVVVLIEKIINKLKNLIMKKISLKDLKNGLKRDEMRSIQGGGCGGGADYLASWKCCNGNGCGTCSSSTGIPTCSTGYTLHACK